MSEPLPASFYRRNPDYQGEDVTLSNPSPDTGAGTPEDAAWDALWEDLRHNATGRPSGLAIIAQHRPLIDAARSRPATDPAGLDALRASMETFAAARERDVRDNRDAPDNINEIVAAVIRGWLARLSVADGPGPEERRD